VVAGGDVRELDAAGLDAAGGTDGLSGDCFESLAIGWANDSDSDATASELGFGSH